MKEFEVWMEGYSATGESQVASLLGKVSAETFDEAVENYMNSNSSMLRDYNRREKYGPRNEQGVMEKYISHSVWGCRLFDNETEARKSFG